MTASLRSMTGFGSGSGESEAYRVRVEVRSVNHRYLKITAHVPDSLPRLQHRVEELIRGRFGRGSFNVTLKIETLGGRADSLIDRDRVRTLHRELSEVHRELTGSDDAPDVSITELLAVEGVLRSSQHSEPDLDQMLKVAEGALDEALGALTEMQDREGGHLRDEMRSIVDSIAGRLDTIDAALPAAAEENKERYRARLKDFLVGTGVEPAESDVLREVAFLAEKADITEEIGRLRGHFDQYWHGLKTGGRIGRKLDFLTQEMFREANTMAAKVNQFEVARDVLEVKADIDRLREQTQNIE